MDRHNNIDEEYGSEYYKEKDYRNFGAEGEDNEEEEFEEVELQYHGMNESNTNGNRLPSGQELQEINQNGNHQNEQYSAPNFAPIKNQSNLRESQNDPEDQEIKETYYNNNPPRNVYDNHYDDNEDNVTTGTNFNNRLLDCKSNRKKVEQDVQA